MSGDGGEMKLIKPFPDKETTEVCDAREVRILENS